MTTNVSRILQRTKLRRNEDMLMSSSPRKQIRADECKLTVCAARLISCSVDHNMSGLRNVLMNVCFEMSKEGEANVDNMAVMHSNNIMEKVPRFNLLRLASTRLTSRVGLS
jgi:hypothetical protein